MKLFVQHLKTVTTRWSEKGKIGWKNMAFAKVVSGYLSAVPHAKHIL